MALWRSVKMWMQGKGLGNDARKLIDAFGTSKSVDVVVPVRRIASKCPSRKPAGRGLTRAPAVWYAWAFTRVAGHVPPDQDEASERRPPNQPPNPRESGTQAVTPHAFHPAGSPPRRATSPHPWPSHHGPSQIAVARLSRCRCYSCSASLQFERLLRHPCNPMLGGKLFSVPR